MTTQMRRARAVVGRTARGAARGAVRLAYRLPRPIREPMRPLLRRAPARVRRFVAHAIRYGYYQEPKVLPPRPAVPETPVRLFVGPANYAGQGWAWARAAEKYVPGVGARTFIFVDGSFGFPVDYSVPVLMYARSKRWQKEQRAHLTQHYSHVLIEAERPVMGTLYGPRADGDIKALRKAGLQVGLVAHGSDVRVPSRHAQLFPESPFHDSQWDSVPILERTATHNVGLLNGYDGHVYVSTLDLLDYVPEATWLPAVVDPEVWGTEAPVLERSVPVVVHAPSKGRLKGSALIDPIMTELDRRGVVAYRRIERVEPHEMPALYQDADIVIDQFTMGLYGVAACEAMAAGRVVVSFVGDTVRQRVREHTGHELPIVEASADSLVKVVESILDDRAAAVETAAAGPGFVREIHDGRKASEALTPFLTGGDS